MTKFNPFRPQSLVHPGMFSGRHNEIRIIEQSLVQAKNGNPNHFLIEGERGIGKSSLLLFLQRMAVGALGNDYNFISVYVELNGSSSFNDIVQRVQSSLKSELLKQQDIKEHAKGIWDFVTKWEVLGVKYNSNEDKSRYQLLDNLASALVDVLSGIKNIKGIKKSIDGVLILIDEADKPAEEAGLGEFIKLLTERLTFGGAENVLIGLAGLPTTIPKLKASHESSPRVFQILNLQPLTTDESLHVIELGLKEANEKNHDATVISDTAKNLIVTLAEGYPHFLQQFAYSAFDSDTDNTISDEDVLSGAFRENGAMEQLGRKFFSDLYFNKINSDEYRKVLKTMAKFGDNWISRAQIIETSKLSDHTVSNALMALKDRNIIQASESVRGQYRLPTKSFATWINAYQSFEKEDKKVQDGKNIKQIK